MPQKTIIRVTNTLTITLEDTELTFVGGREVVSTGRRTNKVRMATRSRRGIKKKSKKKTDVHTSRHW